MDATHSATAWRHVEHVVKKIADTEWEIADLERMSNEGGSKSDVTFYTKLMEARRSTKPHLVKELQLLLKILNSS